MASYLNLHHGVNTRRQEAASLSQQQQQQAAAAAGGGAAQPGVQGAGPPVNGPRVMLLGPTDCGKSSLSRMLVNWGVRAGWEPMFVDLDVGKHHSLTPSTHH